MEEEDKVFILQVAYNIVATAPEWKDQDVAKRLEEVVRTFNKLKPLVTDEVLQ